MDKNNNKEYNENNKNIVKVVNIMALPLLKESKTNENSKKMLDAFEIRKQLAVKTSSGKGLVELFKEGK